MGWTSPHPLPTFWRCLGKIFPYVSAKILAELRFLLNRADNVRVFVQFHRKLIDCLWSSLDIVFTEYFKNSLSRHLPHELEGLCSSFLCDCDR